MFKLIYLFWNRPVRFYNEALFRIRYGFYKYETWDLGYLTAEWLLPRLVYFRQNLNGYPGNLTMEQWEEILDKIIVALRNAKNNDDMNLETEEGCKLLGQYLLHIWD